MVWMGARCDTARQIWDVLELGVIGEAEDVHRAFGEVLQRIGSSGARSASPTSNKSTSTTKHVFRMANRIYVDESYEIVDEFSRLLASVCSTDVGRVDFNSGDVDRCRTEINRWVAEETDGNVQNLVRDDCLNASTRIVIVNAVHLSGTWLAHSRSNRAVDDDAGGDAVTKPTHATAPFYRRKFEDAVQVTMEENKGAYQFVVDYDFKCKVLELPYIQGNLSMLVFLPFDVEGLLAFETKLTPELIKFLKKSMTKTKLTVALPQIRFSQSMPMSPVLTRMGIEDLFCADRADLSGITGTRDLHFFELIHSVSLNHATSSSSPPPPLYDSTTRTDPIKKKKKSQHAASHRSREMAFIADHPFMFLIYDRSTKLIAFIGRFADPTAMSYDVGETTTSQLMADIQVNVEHY